MKPRVVIVGGGAGGLELAIRLAARVRRGEAGVTLIDRNPTHLWKPRLHEIAAGLLVPADEAASYAELAAEHGFEFLLGEMTGIDPAAQWIDLAAVRADDRRIAEVRGDLIPPRRLTYDIAALAIGSIVNDFGISGVMDHCFTLDSPDDAERLHHAVMSLAARVKAGATEALRVAIVGAGTTGVELAAELRNATRELPQYRSLIEPTQLEISVIEMADRPLPALAKETSRRVREELEAHEIAMRFNSAVARVEPGVLVLSDQTRVAADVMVWASGVRGSPVVDRIPSLQLEKGKRIRVDAHLRAMSSSGESIETFYCLGDCAAFRPPGSHTPMGATAQVAEQQAQFLARVINQQLQGRQADTENGQKGFEFHDRGTLVSLGRAGAVGNLPFPGLRSSQIQIEGISAKIAYLALYRRHLMTLFGWWPTVLLTLSALLRRSASPSAKLRW